MNTAGGIFYKSYDVERNRSYWSFLPTELNLLTFRYGQDIIDLLVQAHRSLMADVNLLLEDGKEYIEIIVGPSSYPVNYKGEYHYRSGSTKQPLRGVALTEFLTSRTGIKWEDAIVEDIQVEDLDKESFDIFRREAVRSKRMTKEDLNMSDKELLDSLKLMKDQLSKVK